MRNLIKISIILFSISIVSESFAQTFGIKAGLNLSNMLAKDNDKTYSEIYKMQPGFNLGGMVEFPVSDMFSFETSLMLSTKGYRVHKTGTNMDEPYDIKIRQNLFYIDIPLTAKVSFDVGKTKIYGAFGPYIGVGLSGKEKYDITSNGETDKGENDTEWGSDEDNLLKRFDFGLTFGAGVSISSIQIGLSYDLGLANIASYTDDGYKIKNRVLGISIGYKFGE